MQCNRENVTGSELFREDIKYWFCPCDINSVDNLPNIKIELDSHNFYSFDP